MTGFSHRQATLLAELLCSVRRDWRFVDIVEVLDQVRGRSLAVVAYAALRAAGVDENPPEAIAAPGPHWPRATASKTPLPDHAGDVLARLTGDEACDHGEPRGPAACPICRRRPATACANSAASSP